MKNWTIDDVPNGFFKTKLGFIMAEKGLTIKAAAKEIGCSCIYLSKIASGKNPCGRGMALKISVWSGGRIKPLELIMQARTLE